MNQIGTCSVCFAPVDTDICAICADPQRDRSLLCVVANHRDLIAIERANEFRGLYHVLGGVISPLKNTGPDQLRIQELIHRIQQGEVKELVLSMGPWIEDETTALYIQRLLRPFGIQVRRMPPDI